MVIAIPLREADTVRRLAARDDYFLDPELAGRFDDVVGAQHVAPKAFRVRDEHVAGVGREVDDGVWGLDTGAIGSAGVLVVREVEVGGQGVEGLAGVGQVRFQRMDAWMRQGREVDVEDLVAAGEEIGYAVLAR